MDFTDQDLLCGLSDEDLQILLEAIQTEHERRHRRALERLYATQTDDPRRRKMQR